MAYTSTPDFILTSGYTSTADFNFSPTAPVPRAETQLIFDILALTRGETTASMGIETGAGTDAPITHLIGNNVVAPFNLVSQTIRQTDQLVFGATIEADTSAPVGYLVGKDTDLVVSVETGNAIAAPFGIETQAETRASFCILSGADIVVPIAGRLMSYTDIVFSLNARPVAAHRLPLALTVSVGTTTIAPFRIDDKMPIRSATRLPFDIIAETGSTTVLLPVLDNDGNTLCYTPTAATPAESLILPINASITLSSGEIVDIESATIAQDEDSWTWQFNANFNDYETWQKLKPSNGNYPEITFTVRGHAFTLMIEGAQRNLNDVSHRYAINGRGLTARLDGKYASSVETSWTDAMASSIIGALCSAAGITLDYQAVDWPIKQLDGQGRYPIDIINQLANAIGAVVQTSTDGQLIVMPRYGVKPSEYWTAGAVDLTVTDLDDYETLDERWDDRNNYNVVSIGDGAIEDSAQQQLRLEVSNNTNADGDLIDQQKVAKIYAIPFIDSITLEDSAEGALTLYYEGIRTETITETVEIIHGQGQLSKPVYGGVSIDYIHADLGAITATEAGALTSSTDGISLAEISYTTKYHQYRIERTSTDPQLQIYAEVAA